VRSTQRRDWHQAAAAEPLVCHGVSEINELSVSSRGLVLADHPSGMLALDVRSGVSRAVVEDDGFYSVPSSHWLDGGRALVLRRSFAGAEIALVVVDVARWLEG
jgi:hypothetical protein